MLEFIPRGMEKGDFLIGLGFIPQGMSRGGPGTALDESFVFERRTENGQDDWDDI